MHNNYIPKEEAEIKPYWHQSVLYIFCVEIPFFSYSFDRWLRSTSNFFWSFRSRPWITFRAPKKFGCILFLLLGFSDLCRCSSGSGVFIAKNIHCSYESAPHPIEGEPRRGESANGIQCGHVEKKNRKHGEEILTCQGRKNENKNGVLFRGLWRWNCTDLVREILISPRFLIKSVSKNN